MARQQIQASVKDDAAGNITEIDYHSYLDTLTNVVGGKDGQLLYKNVNTLGYKTITDNLNSKNSTDVLSANMGRKLNSDKLDKTNLLDLVYPIGSLYMSTNNSSPASKIGGTWEQFGGGRVLVGLDKNDPDFNAVQKVGGEKAHSLTSNENGYHRHNEIKIFDSQWSVGSYTSGTGLNIGLNNSVFGDAIDPLRTSYSGSGIPHNNLQPYITVNMWKRTA